jgi:hypothetical protein
MKKIILFELNEVPTRVLEYFVVHRRDSTLNRILPMCRMYQTHAEDRVLSPWVTWPSVHRGVTDSQHHIHNFGQSLAEVDREFPTIWQRLASKGLRVGVFGSLHTYPLPENVEQYDFFVPDVFAAGSECFPSKIEAFQDFNLTMSRASARNVSRTVPWMQTLRFLSSLPDLGIRMKTVADVGQQLVSEKMDHTKTCRRRTYQVVLAFDIFMKQLAQNKPDFCTFFTNHVASSMHRYWAAAFPDDYEVFNHEISWVQTYNDEIMFAMRKFDEMLGRLTKFVDTNKNFELWIATSMGQAATTAEPCECELFVKDDAQFANFFGLVKWERRPAMVPDFGLLVAEEEADSFDAKLRNLAIGSGTIIFKRTGSFFSISLGHLHQKGKKALYRKTEVEFSEIGLENQIIEDHTGSTAYHIPAGCLMIYGKSPAPGATISTTDIFRALLGNFGIGPRRSEL